MNEMVPHMRILLALMFFTPIIAFAAIQRGMETVTPVLIVVSLAAIAAQLLLERRKARA